MKKILPALLFIVTLLFANKVYAENKLYFTDEGDRLYYDTDQIDKELFMNHQDMVPGSSYTDELLIENGSTTDYTLFFKVKEREQSATASAFLDEVAMKIYLDDVLVYDGFAKGLDYNLNGVNLQEVIKIGTSKANETHKIRVETSLSKEFSDISDRDASYIDWEFYAQYEEKVIPIEPNPNTGDKITQTFILFGVSLLAIVILLFIIMKKRKHNKA